MRVQVTAAAGALVIAGLFCAPRAFAQSDAPPQSGFEFSSNVATAPLFVEPRFSRHALADQIAAVPPGPSVTTAPSWPGLPVTGSGVPDNALGHFLLSGVADLVRGDPAGAAEIFAPAAAIAGVVPQIDYLSALSSVLSDFPNRGDALPLLRSARAEDPDHPLYAILDVIADSTLSEMRPDGALYLTQAGAQLLAAAAARLPAQRDAYNGKFAAVLFAEVESTGDARFPARLKDFATMLGEGRHITLPQMPTPQALGRILVLSLPAEAVARYDSRFVAGAETDFDASGAAAPARHDAQFATLVP